jgi:hypothetical protein
MTSTITITHRAIILLNCLMITSAFRAVRFHVATTTRWEQHPPRISGAFFVNHRHSSHVNQPTARFSTTTTTTTTTTTNSDESTATNKEEDDGKFYRIKSTTYTDNKYDLTNKRNGLAGTSYDPSSFEKQVYEWWENSGCFNPDTSSSSSSSDGKKKEPYVLPMPPPNVTGRLHMGHAIFVALQDVLARFHRMRGKEVLWTPGTDHAGIATQLQVSMW